MTINFKILRGEGAKRALFPSENEQLHTRLFRRFTHNEIELIYEIEAEYHEAIETRQAGTLFTLIYPTLQKYARNAEAKYRGYAISRHEFESYFFEEVARLLERGKTNRDYTFYETLLQALPKRAIDVVRLITGAYNRQIEFERSCVTLERQHESMIAEGTEITPYRSPMEGRAKAKLIVEHILKDKELSEEELLLLSVMYDNPNDSLRDWAKKMNASNPMRVKRSIEKIRKKLQKYNVT